MTFSKKQETTRSHTQLRKTTCGNCPAGCGLKVYVINGRVVDIFGDEEHPINKGSICPKGMLTYFHLNNPKRITTPGIREDLSQPFRTVSWDEAIAFTAKQLQKIEKDHGKESIFIHGNETDPFDHLAAGTWFAKKWGTPNIPSRFFAQPFSERGNIQEMFGLPASHLLMNTPRDWCNSRCILIYSSDIAASDPITFGPILDARDRGATVLVIDTKRTVTSSKATFSVRVKPGTQATFLKGVIRHLISEGLIDNDFLLESTEGFGHLKGAVEPFIPELVAKHCWVDQKSIETMAGFLGKTKPIQVLAGDWNNRRGLSDDDLYFCAALACVSGSIGIPGGGLNLIGASPFFTTSKTTELTAGEERENRADRSKATNIEEVLLNSDNPPGAILWYGNPAARLTGGRRTKAVLDSTPLVVHLSVYPNETYHHAHVSLPMSFWLEYTGLYSSNNGRAIQCHTKVVQPPHECRSPLEFWTDLAFAINAVSDTEWKLPGGTIDPPAAIDYFLQSNPLTKMLSFMTLDPETTLPGGVLWPCTDSSHLVLENSRFIKGTVRGLNILFQRGKNYPLSHERFPTPSGKIDFQSLSISNQSESEQSDEIENTYPLYLITGVQVDYVESFGHFVTDRQVSTPARVLKIHPILAGIIGIKAGETLTLKNEVGILSAPAWLSEEVDPRVVWCSAGVDPFQPHFNCSNPKSLFCLPEAGTKSKPYSRVTVYKNRSDAQTTQKKLIHFLSRFNTGYK
jgi:anaerobic selenocysteine-containing dehydrogenase